MNATDLHRLNGSIVLVRSTEDRRNPPTGRRGTLVVRDAADGGVAAVLIELEFPQMFTSRAHHRTIELSDAQLAEMLATESDGTFHVTIAGPLDPAQQGARGG